MAYSAELIISGETYTANVIKGQNGDTGARGADGVAYVPVYDDGTQLTERISVLKFIGGGKIVTASGNEITVNIPSATNDYNLLINKPTLFDGSYSNLADRPTLFSGSYTDLTSKPVIPSDLSQLDDSQGLLSSFTFNGSYLSLTDLPALFSGSYNDLTNKPILFDGSYNSLTDLPALFSESYNDLTDLPDLNALDYVTPSSLTTTLTGYVSDSQLTSTLLGYAQTSVLSDYVTTSALTTVLNSELSNYVLTSTLNTTLANYVLSSTLTSYATQSFVNSAIAQLVDSSPAALNTLNELAAALGDDPNFATTVATQIGTKANTADLANVATSGSYFDLGDTPPTFDSSLSEKTTDNLTEGSNFYYTDARVQTKLANVSGDIIPTTDLIYDLGSPTKRFKDLYLSGNSIYLGNNLILFNDAGKFSARDYLNNPVTVSLANNNTDDITEGQTNLYYTTARADADFDTRLATKYTTDLAEGGSNLYWTVTRGESMFDDHLATKTTTDLAEGGSNLYYTEARVEGVFDTRLALKSTDDVSEGSSNLYWTVARGESMMDTHLTTKTTDNLTEGPTNLYYTTARANADFDNSLSEKTTDNLTEGPTNLYYTDARVDANIASKTTDLPTM